MTRIQTLRPNVTREEAVRQFSGGLSGRLRELSSGPLHSVADFYIPFRIFQVEITNAGKNDRKILGIDAVTGSLDPYYFEQMSLTENVRDIESRNCLSTNLDLNQLEKIAVTKVQRVLFTRGFFRVRNLSISLNPDSKEIHIPYWVGFRGRSDAVSFEVIDAVRRQPEGARVRRLLRDWLATPSNPTPNAAFPSVF
jgi:hypothetical protein